MTKNRLEGEDEKWRLRCDTPEFGRSTGQLGRPKTLAGIFRYVLEADLFDRAQSRSDRRRSAGSRAGNCHHRGEEDRQIEIRSGDRLLQRLAFANHALANRGSVSQTSARRSETAARSGRSDDGND